ncbi:ewing's tumor-associated antigen 1 [Pelodytes ibericus]
MSRRKLATDRSRAKPQLENEKEEAGEKRNCRDGGGSDRETPKKAVKRLGRCPRPGGVSTQISNLPLKSEKEEELCLNKKTPKRLSKSKSWSSTIYSPSNDAEQQHEIFWDPHSPTPFKLENGRLRQIASKCAVDISDIVNRIAPQDEKPSNPDEAYLGMWIGDDAIPCTPVVARARTKINRSRIIDTENELMKLAKQFDRNLVETVQYQEQHGNTAHSKNTTVNLSDAQNNDVEAFLDDIPAEDMITLDLKSVSQSSSVCISVPCQKSSQTSVDQDAEEALNALFDSSTQKCTGQLSQSLSDISTSSLHELPLNAQASISKSALLENVLFEKPTPSKKSALNNKLNSVVFHSPIRNRAMQKPHSPPLSTVEPIVSNSQDDFGDEWGTDLLDDDSFVMQITQNPSLIATPKQITRSATPCNAYPRLIDTNKCDNVKSPVKCVETSTFSNKLNCFKFVSRTLNECGTEAKPISNNKPEKINIFHRTDGNHVNERRTPKSVSGTVTRIPLKSQINSEVCVARHSDYTSPATETFKNRTNTGIFELQTSSFQQTNNVPVKTFPQTAAPKHAGTVNKGSTVTDEWDDPKFSDEILDMFCESDSLWETNEEEDDLLYQVCDDVERLTQTQVVDESNKNENKHVSSTFKNSTNMGESTTNQGLIHQSGSGSNATSSASNASTNILNTTKTSHCTASRICGSSLNSLKNSLKITNQAPAVFSRSTTAPTGGQCEHKKAIPNLQNSVRPQNTTFSAKNTTAPSKYTFTRIKTQISVGSSINTHAEELNLSRDNSQDLGENRKQFNNVLQASTISRPQPSLKRHLSESLLQSTKVFVSEEGNKKCSMEEIERKKQEALARRQMKTRAFSSDTPRT